MKVLKLIAVLSMPLMALSAQYQGSCATGSGFEVGPSGDQDIKRENNYRGTSFKRTNGSRCPCSYAETKCTLDDPIYGTGRDCNDLVIDGRAAAANGYPNVRIKYSMKLCNYNNENQMKLVDPPRQTKVELYYPIQGTEEDAVFIVDKSYNGRVLNPNQCEDEDVKSITVNTSRGKYFLKAILQGTQQTRDRQTIEGGFCYSFSYTKVDFKYDYGLGECRVSTSTNCSLTDGSGKDCADHINSLSSCTPFEATFSVAACNRNNRDIQLLTGASNYKINTYDLKDDGTYKREKKTLAEEIKANKCQYLTTTKIVDPCQKNFYQINLQGRLYNEDAENGWVYKDKECNSYAFDALPVLDPRGRSDGKGKGGGGGKKRNNAVSNGMAHNRRRRRRATTRA